MSPVSTDQNAKEEIDQVAIYRQLEKVLSSSHFNLSRRLPTFLQYVVDQTLSGNFDLKERTLGIEIFGRKPDYDNAADPIVRVTAAEIRKRLALYYNNQCHANELRISLPIGSYIPEFHDYKAQSSGGRHTESEITSFEHEAVSPGTHAIGNSDVSDTQDDQFVGNFLQYQSHARGKYMALSLSLAVVLCCASAFLWQSTRNSAFNSFWGPVLNAKNPILVCLADQTRVNDGPLRDAADPSKQTVVKGTTTSISVEELATASRLISILQSQGTPLIFKGENSTTLTDLRKGPTILVGAFDNIWTLRLTDRLRYHFENNQEMTEFRIVDRNSPSQKRWILSTPETIKGNFRDYAIIARFTDETTGQLAIVISGIGPGATNVASEFVTDRSHLALLQRSYETSGNKKNMELVLSTQIVDGQPGAPRIEETYFW